MREAGLGRPRLGGTALWLLGVVGALGLRRGHGGGSNRPCDHRMTLHLHEHTALKSSDTRSLAAAAIEGTGEGRKEGTVVEGFQITGGAPHFSPFHSEPLRASAVTEAVTAVQLIRSPQLPAKRQGGGDWGLSGE